jgi:NitT/TauT family transport system permease protein
MLDGQAASAAAAARARPGRIVVPRAAGLPDRRTGRWLLPLISVALGLLIWERLAESGLVAAYLLPAPSAVGARWLSLAHSGVLWHHLSATLTEAALGFSAAFVFGCCLGYAIARAPLLDQALGPYIAATQAMPMVALAPLLVVWFGLGLLSKVLICALIVFFPMLVNTVVGLRSIDRSLLDAAHSEGADSWQRLWKVEAPLSLRTLLGGVKMGLTLAMTGAVVGEFVASDAGLGYLMNLARTEYDAPMVFAAALTMAAVAVGGYLAVNLLERALITWE